MAFYYIIVVFFLIYTNYNYKKSLFLWAAICIVMHTGICLKYSSPAISVQLAINLIFLFYYIVKRRRIYHLREDFAFKPIFIIVSISFILSSFVSAIGLFRNLITIFGLLVCNFLTIYLLDKEILTKKDINELIKNISYLIIISCIYGLYTMVLGSNPIIEYELSFIPSGMEDKLVDSSDTMRGLKMQSFFGGATQFSAFVMLTIITFCAVNKTKGNATYLQICLFLLGIVFAFLTKTRASMFAALVTTLYFAFKQKSTQYIKIIILILILLPLIKPFLGENMVFIESIFKTSSQDEVGGSSIDLRLQQAAIVWQIFLEHPILGEGINSLSYTLNKFQDLFGAESIWFQLLLERGLLGLVSYIYIFYYSIKKVSAKYKVYIICCALFWLVQHTLSTTGLYENFYLLSAIIIYKTDKLSIYEKNRVNNISRVR